MRTTTLLSTTAAVLMIGGGLALAQGKSDLPPERAPAAQRSAPAEKVAPPMNAGERRAPETTGQATPDKLEPGSGASTQMKSTTGAGANGPGADSKSKPSANGAMDKGSMDKDAMKKADDAKAGATADTKADAKTNARADTKTDTKSGTTAGTSSGDKASAGASADKNTTGQGAAAGAAKLTTEQRSKITTIIKQKNVQPVNLNISVRVGTRVPSTVRFYPVPVEVVEIYPEWRGYDYIIVGGDILILEPGTHVIVAIIAV